MHVFLDTAVTRTQNFAIMSATTFEQFRRFSTDARKSTKARYQGQHLYCYNLDCSDTHVQTALKDSCVFCKPLSKSQYLF